MAIALYSFLNAFVLFDSRYTITFISITYYVWSGTYFIGFLLNFTIVYKLCNWKNEVDNLERRKSVLSAVNIYLVMTLVHFLGNSGAVAILARLGWCFNE